METFWSKSFAKPRICYFLESRAELFRLAVRKKSTGLSSCFLPLHGNNLKKIFSKSFCIFCGLFFGSFPVIGQEKLLSDCQNCIHCIYKIILKKKLFWQTNEIFHHFQTLSWKFPASFRVFRRGRWNCILGVQGNILTKNSFISNFFFIFGHWASFLTNSRKKSSGVVKTGFSVSMETFGWKFFVKLTNCYVFEYRAENFRLAVRKKSAVLASCFLPLHRNTLKKKILKHFCILWTFFRSFPVIEQEKFGRPVKTAFFVSIRSFWKKKLFWKTIEIFHHFQTLSWKFPASFGVSRWRCWNCILRVQGNVLTKNSFISIFFSSLDTEQIFWPILAKKVAELSKLDSPFQWRLSGASPLQNLEFVIFLNFERNYFGWLSEKSPRGFQAASYLSMGTIWRKFFRKVFASFVDFFSDHFQ